MSPDILLKVKDKLTNNFKLTDKQTTDFLELFSRYKKGQLIYPGAFIRKTYLSMSVVYKILEDISSSGVLERNFEVFCPSCSRYTGGLFSTLKDIPEELECDECETPLNFLDNSLVVYKVVLD
ncbi:hypothetical protein [Bacillus atrophaeus]|uniref:hypothetical protein n=1 Tax=Bacillus atrophaeus TaxID=1452 RepID=UPI00227F4305|nr:hypothetical protein [Bacillus atrophaeus]MCY8514599.1 hypothetical protein [Bacillus atrophaeus]